MSSIEPLHFLRPEWLFMLPIIGAAWWCLRKRSKSTPSASTLIAPHLRAALLVGGHRQARVQPLDNLVLVLLLLTLAAAGPSWRQLPSPWFAETAPLVIALEVSNSMRSNDLQPTRLDRARFKILDLIAQRTGSRTALIAYAGSAHLVLPPTKDIAVIKPFLESLDPAIMPLSGSNASAVLPLAMNLLQGQATAGTLLFVNDGFNSADIPALSHFSRQIGAPSMAALIVANGSGDVALMPDGTPVMNNAGERIDIRVNAEALNRIARETDMALVRIKPGDTDIRQLLRRIESNLYQANDPDALWQDESWWLLWPAALLCLLWFRRGWTLQQVSSTKQGAATLMPIRK